MNQIHELGILFEEVQLKNVLGDGKTFPDCLPKRKLDEISTDYLTQKDYPEFDLKKFILENFLLPEAISTGYKSDLSKSIEYHISTLWDVLTRQPDKQAGSLIPLPHPYLVPGGRFREIYYWDSYFTMLGLRESGRADLTQNMVDNFAFLKDRFGYIPNGNRTYFLGRSQPPFFSLMVKLLHEEIKEEIDDDELDPLAKYLPHLEKEYHFWMRGTSELNENNPAVHRVVRMPDGSILNRYWDEFDSPRPEAYKEDIALSHQSSQKPDVLFRHLRAAAESGWDFSSRWFKDEKSFESIHTTEIIPVDLNCLLFYLEKTLSEIYQYVGNNARAGQFLLLANQRKASIKKFCWDEERKFFFDFDFILQRQKQPYTAAAAFPLFVEIATPDQALAVEVILKRDFLKANGLTTTLNHSGQQWDAPNGWAPLQWIGFKGLRNYGFEETAAQIRKNWLSIIDKVFSSTGKMTEKYNVWSHEGKAGGGEYPNHDGFGWTNGVYLAMKNS